MVAALTCHCWHLRPYAADGGGGVRLVVVWRDWC